jgi:hypothetical protein
MLVTVAGSNGKPVRAFTYIHTSPVNNAPSQVYANTISAGYRFWGFDLELLRAAIKRSPARAEPQSFRVRGNLDGLTAKLAAEDAADRAKAGAILNDARKRTNLPVQQPPGGLDWEQRSDGKFVGTTKYTPPAGRPRSTPPRQFAKPVNKDGQELPGWWGHPGWWDGVSDAHVQPHDCDCPNYRKNCRLPECPRFDNTMDDDQ